MIDDTLAAVDPRLSRELFIGDRKALEVFLNSGRLTPASFVGYWGLVFGAVGWWKYCDPLRSSRVKIGALAWALLIGWGATALAPFAQPFGILITGIIAVAVPLTSRWLAPAERIVRE
ncbi:MAG: hypothetical protein QM811_21975 [Pirellulales bacterium]